MSETDHLRPRHRLTEPSRALCSRIIPPLPLAPLSGTHRQLTNDSDLATAPALREVFTKQ